jgi:predicted signal transduction protein with EAL and GGDEF domain
MIPDGRWMQVVNHPLAEGGWVVTIEDVTEQRRSEERVVRLALYDTLTELPNRTLFSGSLRRRFCNAMRIASSQFCFWTPTNSKA